MAQVQFGSIREGMNISDRNGEKIGTVRKVHQLGRAVGGPQAGAEGYLQVETSLPELGKELYIPFNALRECRGDTCLLNVTKDEISRKGWDRKPANL